MSITLATSKNALAKRLQKSYFKSQSQFQNISNVVFNYLYLQNSYKKLSVITNYS